MKKYCVSMTEKIFYEIYVEADNAEEAEEKANKLFDNSDERVSVIDQYVYDVYTEEKI